jgi:hypothetical protein
MQCIRCRVKLKKEQVTLLEENAESGSVSGRRIGEHSYCPKCNRTYQRKVILDDAKPESKTTRWGRKIREPHKE